MAPRPCSIFLLQKVPVTYLMVWDLISKAVTLVFAMLLPEDLDDHKLDKTAWVVYANVIVLIGTALSMTLGVRALYEEGPKDSYILFRLASYVFRWSFFLFVMFFDAPLRQIRSQIASLNIVAVFLAVVTIAIDFMLMRGPWMVIPFLNKALERFGADPDFLGSEEQFEEEVEQFVDEAAEEVVKVDSYVQSACPTQNIIRLAFAIPVVSLSILSVCTVWPNAEDAMRAAPYVSFEATGCMNWNDISSLRPHVSSRIECEEACNSDAKCQSYNFQETACDQQWHVSNGCVIFHGRCQHGHNECWDMHYKPAFAPD
jgi:hypothetical protein